jgi:predicted O-linked N-acetylglucosamine transferase (SPINDLY family)
MPDVADRILFLPFQKDAEYLHLVAAANVVLDPIYYGGMSTAYDAFSVGTPIVTQPSPFQRGRYAAALYRRLDLDIGIAANASDYAHRAVLLATNEELRRSVRQAITDRSDAIFQDHNVVHAYGEAFRRFVAEARQR